MNYWCTFQQGSLNFWRGEASHNHQHGRTPEHVNLQIMLMTGRLQHHADHRCIRCKVMQTLKICDEYACIGKYSWIRKKFL